jgi:hypothetical protein
VIAGLGPESFSSTENPEVAMTFDLEEDFENERWRLLALVDRRKSLRDGSERAIKIDLEIVGSRELIRTYETLKGYWSRKASPHGTQRRVVVARLESRKSGERSGSPHTSAGVKFADEPGSIGYRQPTHLARQSSSK